MSVYDAFVFRRARQLTNISAEQECSACQCDRQCRLCTCIQHCVFTQFREKLFSMQTTKAQISQRTNAVLPIISRRPENSLDNVFLVINLFYNLQSGSNGFITEGRRGSNFFQGVGVSKETHITCDFPGRGGPDPLTPSGSARGVA